MESGDDWRGTNGIWRRLEGYKWSLEMTGGYTWSLETTGGVQMESGDDWRVQTESGDDSRVQMESEDDWSGINGVWRRLEGYK